MSKTLHRLGMVRPDGADDLVYFDPEQIKAIGDRLTSGAINTVCRWVLLVALLSMAMSYLARHGTWLSATDATDASPAERSGMRLRTDHGTGCQYLESTDGNLTPRLSLSGKQAGCAQ